MLESTLGVESTLGEVKVRHIGSHTSCFSLGSASGVREKNTPRARPQGITGERGSQGGIRKNPPWDKCHGESSKGDRRQEESSGGQMSGRIL